MNRKLKQLRLAEKIKRLTLAGVRQTDISKLLKISGPTTRRYQRLGGLPTRPQVNMQQEHEIMQLYRAGWSGVAIAKHLGIGLDRAYAAAQRNNFQLGTGRPPKKHDVGEALHAALGIVDRFFGVEPVPFESVHDHFIAAGLVTALAERYKHVYRHATEQNLAELQGLLVQALDIKRTCSVEGMVH